MIFVPLKALMLCISSFLHYINNDNYNNNNDNSDDVDINNNDNNNHYDNHNNENIRKRLISNLIYIMSMSTLQKNKDNVRFLTRQK